MKVLDTIIIILSTVLPLIGATITFITKFLKSSKARKLAEDYIKIIKIIEEFMVNAEEHIEYSGQEKKDYVLRCTKNLALYNGLDLDKVELSPIIENLIDFSKKINSKISKSKIKSKNK